MALRVGELAKRSGLTVRTLNHYDDIGLLRPSARSDAGYRLYNRHDIARLHQIQALRSLGLMRGYAGSDPSTHAKIRQAMAQEPVLAESTWLKPATLSYPQHAVSVLTSPAN